MQFTTLVNSSFVLSQTNISRMTTPLGFSFRPRYSVSFAVTALNHSLMQSMLCNRIIYYIMNHTTNSTAIVIDGNPLANANSNSMCRTL